MQIEEINDVAPHINMAKAFRKLAKEEEGFAAKKDLTSDRGQQG